MDSGVLCDLDPTANRMAGTVITGIHKFNTKWVRDSKVTWDISKSITKCGGTIVTSLVNCGGARQATDACTPVALSISRTTNSSQDTELKRAAGNNNATNDQHPEHLKRRQFQLEIHQREAGFSQSTSKGGQRGAELLVTSMLTQPNLE